jgi:serine/threonine protein kinase
MSTQDGSGKSNVPGEQDTPTRLLKEESGAAAGPMDAQSLTANPLPLSDTPNPTIKSDTPTPGKRTKDRTPSATGRTINMWTLAEKLGEGGMGTVYRARHQLLERTVAIKLLRSNLINQGKSRLRFQEEAMAVGALNHKNIVGVFDCGVSEEGEPFLIMELLSGRSLSSVIKSAGRLSVTQAVPIFVQICEGLEHAHKNGTVHRDLKPSNIILADGGPGKTEIVKIVDFGIAKRLSTDGDLELQKLTGTGELVGSPIYMSPEQCRGTTPDARSDVYSLGVLMYETLTGMPPFSGNTFFETLAMHLDSPVPKLAGKGSPQEIANIEPIVRRCLAKFPADRFQSVAEVQEELLKHFKHLIPIETQLKLPFGWSVRKFLTIIGLSVVAVTVALGSLYTYKTLEPVSLLPDSNSYMPFEIWEHRRLISEEQYKQLLMDNNAPKAFLKVANNISKVQEDRMEAIHLRNQGLIKFLAGKYPEAKADLSNALKLMEKAVGETENDLECQEWNSDIAKCLEAMGGKKNKEEAYNIHKKTFDFIADGNPLDCNKWTKTALSYAQLCIDRAKSKQPIEKARKEDLERARDAYRKLIEAIPNQRMSSDTSGSQMEERRIKALAEARCLLADTFRVFERTDAEAKEFGASFFPLRNEIQELKESMKGGKNQSKARVLRERQDQMRLLKKNGLDPAPFIVPRELYNKVIDDSIQQISQGLVKVEDGTLESNLGKARWSRGLLYRKYGNEVIAMKELKLALNEARKAVAANNGDRERRFLLLSLKDYTDGLWKSDPIQAFLLRMEAANLLTESQKTAAQ